MLPVPSRRRVPPPARRPKSPGSYDRCKKQFPRTRGVAAYSSRSSRTASARALQKRPCYQGISPRGGQVITGPSIHLARTLARGMGQCGPEGFKGFGTDGKGVPPWPYCWDLGDQLRGDEGFTVQHIRETKEGGAPFDRLRDILKDGSKSRRPALERYMLIFLAHPGDVVAAAVGQCNVTRSRRMRNAPCGYGPAPSCEELPRAADYMTAEILEAYMWVQRRGFPASVIRLKNVYNIQGQLSQCGAVFQSTLPV